MKIEINETELIPLYSLKSGDTFTIPDVHYDGCLLMRTGIRMDERYTCFNLSDASQHMLKHDLLVREVKAKVVRA